MPQKVKNAEIKKKLNLKSDILFKAFFSRKGNEKYLKQKQYRDIFQEEKNIKKQKK